MPSSHKERISRQWEVGVKQTTLGGCARPENSLQKLLASDTVFLAIVSRANLLSIFDVVFSLSTVHQ